MTPPNGANPYPAPPTDPNPYQQNPYAAQPGYPPQSPQYPPQGYAQPGYAQPVYGYPQQQQPPYAQPGYPQPQYPAQQQAAWGNSQQPATLACRFCGGYPAVEATVRGHQGLLVVMRMFSLRGPFCRTCGISVHREMTTKTMWQGWWGYLSLVITPCVLLYNIIPRLRFNRLPEPRPGFQPPSRIGKPIFLRPGALGILVPLLTMFLILTALAIGD